MTYAAVPALRDRPDARRASGCPRLAATSYDPGLRPPAGKAGAARRHGHDREAGRLRRAGQHHPAPSRSARTASYALTGHKWFCSAPMCDVFLVLAQAPGGLTCFVVPRVLPDGSRNAFRLQRLKDKLGNRSNASREVGVRRHRGRAGSARRAAASATILEMVAATRLDCVLGSAALMRQAVAQAIHHAAHRSAFGGLLVDKPLMRNVLADLALESEAATALALRLAARRTTRRRAADASRGSASRVGKYWVCKRDAGRGRRGAGVPGRQRLRRGVAACRGSTARRRSTPSGRARATSTRSTCCGRCAASRRRSTRSSPRSPGPRRRPRGSTRPSDRRAREARRLRRPTRRRPAGWSSRMALVLQGSLLVRHAPAAVADAFCASRLAADGEPRARAGPGHPPARARHPAVVERATPRPA